MADTEFDADVEKWRSVGRDSKLATKYWQEVIGVTADGVFGPNTEAATRKWQSAHGLTPDGIVGPSTWLALLGVTDFDYPPTLRRTTGTAASAVSSSVSSARPPVSTPVGSAVPSSFASILGGKAPLILGLGLIGAAMYAQYQKNALGR